MGDNPHLLNLCKEGTLARSLREVKEVNCELMTYSQLQSASPDALRDFKGVVVMDNYQWIATNAGKPVDETVNVVQSSDGTLIGTYLVNQERKFLVREVKDKKLVTIDTIVLPTKVEKEEVTNMAEQTVNLTNMDLSGIQQAAKELAQDNAKDAAPKREKSEKTLQREAAIKDLKAKVQDVALANNDNVVLFNQQYGRHIAFVTKTDRCVRLAKASVPKIGADGKKVIKAGVNLTPEEQKKYDEEGKLSIKNQERETIVRFKEARPATIVAEIIATPAGGDVDVTEMTDGSKALVADKSKMDMNYHILTKDSADLYLAALYDGRIKESEEVMGDRAEWLKQKYSQVKAKEVGKNPKVRSTLVVEKGAKATGRKTALTTGNYIPLTGWVTKTLDQIQSESDIEAANLIVEAALRNQESYDKLNDASKAIVGRQADGHYESAYFKAGERTPINEITSFDGTDILSAINLPSIEKKAKKSGDGYTYSYQKTDFATVAARPAVKAILGIIGKTPEQFKEEISAITSKGTSGGANRGPQITASEFLKATQDNKNFDNGGATSFKDLQRILANIN